MYVCARLDCANLLLVTFCVGVLGDPIHLILNGGLRKVHAFQFKETVPHQPGQVSGY